MSEPLGITPRDAVRLRNLLIAFEQGRLNQALPQDWRHPGKGQDTFLGYLASSVAAGGTGTATLCTVDGTPTITQITGLTNTFKVFNPGTSAIGPGYVAMVREPSYGYWLAMPLGTSSGGTNLGGSGGGNTDILTYGGYLPALSTTLTATSTAIFHTPIMPAGEYIVTATLRGQYQDTAIGGGVYAVLQYYNGSGYVALVGGGNQNAGSNNASNIEVVYCEVANTLLRRNAAITMQAVLPQAAPIHVFASYTALGTASNAALLSGGSGMSRITALAVAGTYRLFDGFIANSGTALSGRSIPQGTSLPASWGGSFGDNGAALGTWTLNGSNQVVQTVSLSSGTWCHTSADSGVSDCTILTSLRAAAGGQGIVFRLTDDQNFWRACVDRSNNLSLVKVQAGVATTVAGPVASTAAACTYCVILSGSSITFYANDPAGTSVSATGQTFNQTATRHGLADNGTGSHAYGDFIVQ